jgi:hypothetical protein
MLLAPRRLVENASRSEPIVSLGFHLGGDADLKSATSGLPHQSSRRAKGTETAYDFANGRNRQRQYPARLRG